VRGFPSATYRLKCHYSLPKCKLLKVTQQKHAGCGSPGSRTKEFWWHIDNRADITQYCAQVCWRKAGAELFDSALVNDRPYQTLGLGVHEMEVACSAIKKGLSGFDGKGPAPRTALADAKE
jgi:hypothetical protein